MLGKSVLADVFIIYIICEQEEYIIPFILKLESPVMERLHKTRRGNGKKISKTMQNVHIELECLGQICFLKYFLNYICSLWHIQ